MLKFFHNFFRFAFQKLLTQISFKTEYGFFLLSVWILAVRPSLFLSFSSISSINLSFLPSFSPILTTFFLLSFFFFFLLLFEVFHSTKRAEMRGGEGGRGRVKKIQLRNICLLLFFFFFSFWTLILLSYKQCRKRSMDYRNEKGKGSKNKNKKRKKKAKGNIWVENFLWKWW